MITSRPQPAGRPAPVLLERLAEEGYIPPGVWPRDWSGRVTSTGKAVLVFTPQSRVVRIGLTPAAGEMIANHHRALTELPGLAPHLARLWPRPLAAGRIGGVQVAAEGLVAGLPWARVAAGPAKAAGLADRVDAILGDLARAGKEARLDEGLFERCFAAPVRGVRTWYTAADWGVAGDWFERMIDWMWQRGRDRSLRLPPLHGDLVPQNCLFDRHGDLAGILDWDLYRREGLPLIDYICFLRNVYDPFWRWTAAPHTIDPGVKFLGYPGRFLGELRGRLTAHLETVGTDPELIEPLTFMWWIQQLQDWAPVERFNPAWLTRRLEPIRRRWEEVLVAGEGTYVHRRS